MVYNDNVDRQSIVNSGIILFIMVTAGYIVSILTIEGYRKIHQIEPFKSKTNKLYLIQEGHEIKRNNMIGSWVIEYKSILRITETCYVSVKYIAAKTFNSRILHENWMEEFDPRTRRFIGRDEIIDREFKKTEFSRISLSAEIIGVKSELNSRYNFDMKRVYLFGQDQNQWLWEPASTGNKLIGVNLRGHHNLENQTVVAISDDKIRNFDSDTIQLPITILTEYGISQMQVSIIKIAGPILGAIVSLPFVKPLVGQITAAIALRRRKKTRSRQNEA